MVLGLSGGLLSMILAVGAIIFVVALILYVYMALALMTIAKKTNTPNAWLAWIPIANIYLMTQIGGVPGWVTLAVLLPIIPFVGALVFLVVWIYLWWKVSEARHRPGWWSILIVLIPIVNLIMIGILAWGEAK